MITSFGTDLECFVENKDGDIIPVHDLIGGSKEEPLWCGDVGNLQEDNVCAEFAITPCTDVQEFDEKIVDLRKHLDNKLSEHNCHSSNIPLRIFHNDELTDPRSWEFGCDPDMDAYHMESKTPFDSIEEGKVKLSSNLYCNVQRPMTIERMNIVRAEVFHKKHACNNFTYRTAGGHIHYGLEIPEWDLDMKAEFVKLLDLFVGAPLYATENPDVKTLRMQLYGQYGSFRDKPYGVEYRTPSNQWMRTKFGREFVIKQAQYATNLAMEVGDIESLCAKLEVPPSPKIVDDIFSIDERDIDGFFYNGMSFSEFKEAIHG